jgi:asparagine synthase (glutamine-hydrolysing)
MDRVPKWARRALGLAADRLPYSTRGKNYLRMISRTSAIERYFEHTYAPHSLLERMLRSEWMPVADEATLLRSFAGRFIPGERDTLTQALYFEATAKLASDMLTKVDRMSMAASLEVRCPFLDHELVELSARIPVNWKMRAGRRQAGKRILIDAIGDRLPPGLLARPKMGFGVPIAHWFRGELRAFLRDMLTSQSFVNREIASPEVVRDMIDEHDRGRRDNSYWLWSLLVLEMWLRDLDDGRSHERLP